MNAIDRFADLQRQGFMKPTKTKRTYSVGNGANGMTNTRITSKVEALKVARHYVKHRYQPDKDATYIYVRDDSTCSTVAAGQLQVDGKWLQVVS